MSLIRKLPRGGAVRGKLPRGCVLCQKGAKMVLLVTGRCGAGCFYCPLSAAKAGRDVVFADEMRVLSPRDALKEARLIDALGTGITGGDPLCSPRRAIGYIRLLKRTFGRRHHIHLYTSGRFGPAWTARLVEAGLDEIRFHPGPGTWGNFGGTKVARTMGAALRTGMAVGAEVPAIPGRERELGRLAEALDSIGAHFLNLNELEYSETNFCRLNARGFRVRDDVSSGVLGSERTALAVLNGFDGEMSVHYCSSGFKDGVQLRRRIMRRARNVARPYQVITRDGTLLTGIVEGPPGLLARLRREFGVPAVLSAFNRKKRRVELAPWLVGGLAPRLKAPSFIIEEYPTADSLEVERSSSGGL
jgi:pyruvate formate-lyase activating enzyme-like uncharacterized protein